MNVNIYFILSLKKLYFTCADGVGLICVHEGSPGAGAESDEAAGETGQTQSGLARRSVAVQHRVFGSRHDADKRRVSSLITSNVICAQFSAPHRHHHPHYLIICVIRAYLLWVGALVPQRGVAF